MSAADRPNVAARPAVEVNLQLRLLALRRESDVDRARHLAHFVRDAAAPAS